jgi:hypothetical protein
MPKVDGVEFPYTKAGMQKAQAWAAMTGKPMQMEKEYQSGGRVIADILDSASLEEVAHKRIPGGSVARYTARTQGGDERHLAKFIEGEGGKEKRRQIFTDALRQNIKANPGYSDTLSLEEARNYMNMGEGKSLWDLFKDIIPAFEQGGEIPAGRRMYGTNPKKKKKAVMQTSTAGMHMRGGEQFKKGGKVKMPKGWHV